VAAPIKTNRETQHFGVGNLRLLAFVNLSSHFLTFQPQYFMGSDLNPGLLEGSDGDFNRHQEGL